MKSNLQIVKDFCEDTLECVHCPFYNHIANCCKFTPDPMNWNLTKNQTMRNSWMKTTLIG